MLDGLIDVILDPELGGGSWQYGRIVQSFDENGWPVFTETLSTFDGNIQPAPGRERELLPEGEREKESLLVYTPVALSAGQGERRGDRIYYRDNVYRVVLAEPWREQAGFTKALAVLESDRLDSGPDSDPEGASLV
jgi:hypothetical protein